MLLLLRDGVGASFFDDEENKFNNELNGEKIIFNPNNDNFDDLCDKINPNFVINCIGAIKPTITEKKESNFEKFEHF